jgi:hypothetical protein
MAKFATGKYAKAISDRSGMEFPFKEMVREWNGSLVHISEYEPKQPQLEPKPMNGDAISLRNVRPGRTEPATPRLLPLNAFTTTNEPNHGRSTSDTVRFRNVELVGGIPAATINGSSGFTITVTNANNYTFPSGATATATEIGGGGSASAGPVTQQA